MIIDRHCPWLFNGVVWSLSFVCLLFAFSDNRSTITQIDFVYTLLFLLTLIPPVLLNLYVLMPWLLKQGKVLQFVGAFVVNLLVFSKLNEVFFSFIIDKILPNYFFISYHSNMSLVVIFAVFLVGIMLLKLAEEGFYLQKRESDILKMQKEKTQLELALVRSQLHPHFLFNALNLVYGLSLENSPKTATAIVQLSDILRYVVYDVNVEKVSLEKEVALLKNYVAFQQNRTFLDDVVFTTNIDKSTYRICPMLLLPLLENAFKHGAKKSIDFVYCELVAMEGNLQFVVRNSYQKDETAEQGVGIEMLQESLRLVYPDKHSFVLNDDEAIFEVKLRIRIDA